MVKKHSKGNNNYIKEKNKVSKKNEMK